MLGGVGELDVGWADEGMRCRCREAPQLGGNRVIKEGRMKAANWPRTSWRKRSGMRLKAGGSRAAAHTHAHRQTEALSGRHHHHNWSIKVTGRRTDVTRHIKSKKDTIPKKHVTLTSLSGAFVWLMYFNLLVHHLKLSQFISNCWPHGCVAWVRPAHFPFFFWLDWLHTRGF